MTTVAVLGANGRLGAAAAKAFAEAGHKTIAVTRSGRNPANIPGSVGRPADALDGAALTAATEGADIIFNGLNPPYTAWRSDCMRMAYNVVTAAKAHGALHLFPGNVYNFGAPMQALLTEDLAARPSTGKGRIRVEMEQFFRREAEAHGVRTIILRAGDFFGTSGTGSWFDQVIAAKLGKGTFTYPGPLDRKHAWAYLPDLAATFVRLAETDAGDQPFACHHFPGHTVTGAELKSAIEAALARHVRTAGLPWLVLRFGGLVVPMWREIHEMRYLWDEPHELVSESLQAHIGVVPQTFFDLAVRNALVDLGHLPSTNRQPDAAQRTIAADGSATPTAA